MEALNIEIKKIIDNTEHLYACPLRCVALKAMEQALAKLAKISQPKHDARPIHLSTTEVMNRYVDVKRQKKPIEITAAGVTRYKATCIVEEKEEITEFFALVLLCSSRESRREVEKALGKGALRWTDVADLRKASGNPAGSEAQTGATGPRLDS